MRIGKRFFKTHASIKTNAQLLNNVQEYLAVLQFLFDEYGHSALWYRGVSHAKYALVPKVYRDHLWKIHEDYEWWLVSDFTHKARRFIPESHSYTQWEWYFTMQHYGMPTRLLDWTRGSLIALYFAVRRPQNTHTPCVYVINPYWVDQVVNKTKDGLIYNTDIEVASEEHHDLLASYLSDRTEAPPFPLCLEPPAIHDRIYAQQSVFTIHGRYIHPFTILAKHHRNAPLAKLRFSTNQATRIKDELNNMGITEGVLFPGLEGLVKDIQWNRDVN